MKPNCAVSLSGLALSYGSTMVLDLPELDFPAGQVHALVGGNGAGKTTLLRCIAGLEQPDEGRVVVLGEDLYGVPSPVRLEIMRKMTFCFQKPYLFDASVRGNVAYGLRLRNTERSAMGERVTDALDALGLSHLVDRNARILSAGETQRVSLARALVLQPELVLLDEPTANVDARNVERVEEAILRLHRGGSTIIVATHQAEQALRLSAGIVRLDQGRSAPGILENVFSGQVVEAGDAAYLQLKAGVRLWVSTRRRGPVQAAIQPVHIIISSAPLASSARNCLPGKITTLTNKGNLIAVTIDAGLMLTAHVTQEAYADLALTLGMEVYVTFKASSVNIY